MIDADTAAVLTAPYGTAVEYHARGESGVGTLKLVWCGVTEVIDVRRVDGTVKHVYPHLGETARILHDAVP